MPPAFVMRLGTSPGCLGTQIFERDIVYTWTNQRYRHDFSYSAGDSAGDVVRRMRHLPTAYELREKWSYNNQVKRPSFPVGAAG